MYKFRQAKQSDIVGLLPLLETLFGIEKDFIFDQEKQIQGLELLLTSATAEVIVASTEDMVVGMVTGQLVISTAQGGNSLLVEDLVVHTEHRRKGIATQLLQAVCHWGEKNGASRTQLLADKNNEAGLHFYARQEWLTTDLICLRKLHN